MAHFPRRYEGAKGMKSFKEIVFGPEAKDFVRDRLQEGNTLSRFLLDTCDLDKGLVTTFLPSTVSYELANQFDTGGKLQVTEPTLYFEQGETSEMLMVPMPNSYSCLAVIIREFLGKDQQHLCIFEDVTSKPGDPKISLEDKRILIFNEEVYYQLGRGDDEGTIAKTIRDANSLWHFLCVMSSVSEREGFVTDRYVASEKLKIFAEGAQKIVVGAYDGEGYLIWTKMAESKER